ncbi:MAG: phage holin family protein [Deinococcota bacterium]|jgi:putative membrane protein|nr:phage holin family protein [Deinococcota bacterium]
MNLLVLWVLNALALWLTTELYPGLFFTQPGIWPLLIAALVLGLVNAVVRPIMVLLTLPLTVLTLGLFLLVVNALSLGIVAALTPLAIRSFWDAVVGAIILSIVGWVLNAILRPERSRAVR